MTDPTCAERIHEQAASRLADFRSMLDRASSQDETVSEEAQTEIWETPLAVTVTRVWRIDLSTGGPGDWLEIHTDAGGEPTRAEYHFNDWFDHAQITLQGDDRETAIAFGDQVTGGYYFEADAE